MLSIHTLLFSTNESSRTACIEGIDQDIEFTLLLISSAPLISHSGKQCWPVTPDQDWVVTGLGTPKGNKGQVSIYMLKCEWHSCPGGFKGVAAPQRMRISQHLHSRQTWGSRKNGPAAQEHQPGTELKDTGRNCDERHMMVSENLKRPEHQSTMNNVYKHL